jgi:penicillin G amidase
MKRRIFLSAVLFSGLSGISAIAQVPTKLVSVSGTEAAVTVRRDSRSIPYIEAANHADLYFVQGYVTASDRLWQMDLLRRVAGGETAEIFGRTTIEEDKRWRRFGFRKIAEASLKHLSPELTAALENYARGVNAYIASLDDASLPIEFRILKYKPRVWVPADSVIIGKILADALSRTYQMDLLRESLIGFDTAKLFDLENPVTPYDVVLFGKDLPIVERKVSNIRGNVSENALAIAEKEAEIRERSLRLVGMYAEDLAASNNWVISGKRTADGKAILANDPHLMPATPGIWYLSHLSAPPNVKTAGVTFPGVPGVVLGHNEHIAWGATNVGPDVQDLYVETLRDGKVATPNGWAAPVIRTEQIRYRTSPLDPALSSESLIVTETRNGPIVIENGEKRYSMKWTALDPKNNEFEAFYFLNRARSWDEFKKALENYGGATQNFVYADIKGNIGWYAAGKVPIRRTGDGSLPYDGSQTDGDWVGYIPFGELPHLYNPPEGFILTANQRIVGTGYKYPQISRDAAPPWRARRIYERLSAGKKLTLDDVASIQLDSYNIPLAFFAKDILRLNAGTAENLRILKDWDGTMVHGSRGALLVNEIRNCTANKIAAENKPVSVSMIRERILWRALKGESRLWLPRDFTTWGALLRACEVSTEADLTKRFGADKTGWIWGRAFTARFPHPLAAAPFIGAQFATPNAAISGSGQTPNVGSGVSMRHISSAGNWDATRFVIPLGQSGDPRSPHYKDQFEMWQSVSLAEFPFSDTAIKSAAKDLTTFQPRKD